MAAQTGITKILYGPSTANWPSRTFALYFRNVQALKVEAFLNTATLHYRDAAEIDDAVVVRNVKSVIRRRYPGGPAISVPAHERKVVVGPTIKIGTWPGRPITLERPKDGSSFNPANADVPMTVLQLTLDGSFPDFYAFCEVASRLSFILRTNSGRPIYIKHTA